MIYCPKDRYFRIKKSSMISWNKYLTLKCKQEFTFQEQDSQLFYILTC